MRTTRAHSGIVTRTTLGLAGLAAAGLLAGCGASHSETAMPKRTDPSMVHTMADGTVMSGSAMSGMDGVDDMGDMDAMSHGPVDGDTSGPSTTAAMICGEEIAGTVRRSFGLATQPTGSGSWSPSDHIYTCRYPLVHSLLTLSVKDLDDRPAGRRYFDRLQNGLEGAHRIKGLAGLGFPSFENSRGQVGFLKDGKTLYVDASGVSASDVPRASSRTELAYGVAAAVIACWKE